MRALRLLALPAAVAAALVVSVPAFAADPSGGAMAPADASAETNTGGSVGPAPDPAPAPAPRVTPRATPAPASAPTSSAPSAPTPAVASSPVTHAAGNGNAVEPAAGGDQPATGDDSAPLEPLPPTSGTEQARASQTSSGPSLPMSGGEMVTTLTLGIGFLAAGLAGIAFARRRRSVAAASY